MYDSLQVPLGLYMHKLKLITSIARVARGMIRA